MSSQPRCRFLLSAPESLLTEKDDTGLEVGGVREGGRGVSGEGANGSSGGNGRRFGWSTPPCRRRVERSLPDKARPDDRRIRLLPRLLEKVFVVVLSDELVAVEPQYPLVLLVRPIICETRRTSHGAEEVGEAWSGVAVGRVVHWDVVVAVVRVAAGEPFPGGMVALPTSLFVREEPVKELPRPSRVIPLVPLQVVLPLALSPCSESLNEGGGCEVVVHGVGRGRRGE